MKKTALIIGAGPAGLTAAYELLTKSDIKPIIIEQSDFIGGISKTINYKGNRIDIGGHRFFSKSDVVMKWWQEIMPVQGKKALDELLVELHYHNKQSSLQLNPNGPDPEKTEKVFLIRNRLSRIFFLRKFFDYPISLNFNTIKNIGLSRLIKIGWTYIMIKVFPVKKIESLEDFFVSRFGTELYKTFFKDYTEKVWGTPCSDIAADWGAQRVKELSVSKALLHALKSIFKLTDKSLEQKNTATSLIEQFMYPKLGPGQLWETVASLIEQSGGIIIKNAEVNQILTENNLVKGLIYTDKQTNNKVELNADFVFSTMPVKDLIRSMGNVVPGEVKNISEHLQYRDFITVGILLNKLKLKNETKTDTLNNLIPDTWIYIQEKDVKVGRLQVFNNWSPYMVSDINKVWLGMEYFCNEGDELWSKNDTEFIKFAIEELASIDIIDKTDVVDSTIIREKKTYPAYFGSYSKFNVIQEFTDKYENLFLIGRNGMHKYNNQDHSMLTAMMAVENILNGVTSKANIWEINTEETYHEKK